MKKIMIYFVLHLSALGLLQEPIYADRGRAAAAGFGGFAAGTLFGAAMAGPRRGYYYGDPYYDYYGYPYTAPYYNGDDYYEDRHDYYDRPYHYRPKN